MFHVVRLLRNFTLPAIVRRHIPLRPFLTVFLHFWRSLRLLPQASGVNVSSQRQSSGDKISHAPVHCRFSCSSAKKWPSILCRQIWKNGFINHRQEADFREHVATSEVAPMPTISACPEGVRGPDALSRVLPDIFK
ncbi:hypothetical protein ACLOJK_001436, partial [Asimina triloba]